jgi:hypothetical protein
MGRLSLLAGLAAWIALACSFFFGGLSPTVSQTWVLHALSGGALVAALLAVILALVAISRASQRIAAFIGLAFGLLFLLMFTGAIWSLVK